MSLLDETLRLATTPARLGIRVAEGAVRTALSATGVIRDDPESRTEPEPREAAPQARPRTEAESAPEPEAPELDPRDTVAPVDPGPLPVAEAPAPTPARPEAPAVADPGVEMVAEFGEDGAEEPAGADVHVEPPFEGYDSLKVGEVRERLQAADRMQAAGVVLYERSGQGRRGVIEAAEKRLASLDAAAS